MQVKYNPLDYFKKVDFKNSSISIGYILERSFIFNYLFPYSLNFDSASCSKINKIGVFKCYFRQSSIIESTYSFLVYKIETYRY
jgi:hypothetical protein